MLLLNLGNLLVSEVSENKGTLLEIVENLEELMLYFRTVLLDSRIFLFFTVYSNCIY